MATETVHIVGAGVAGLAAATLAARQGFRVEVHEAAPIAGGRCRSWHSDVLDRTIDNGTHLLIGACRATLDWASSLAALGTLTPRDAAFPFVDLADGTRYTVRPNAGPLPWWPLVRRRRPSGTSFFDFTKACGPIIASKTSIPAGRVLDLDSLLGRRLWAPLLSSVMNIDPAAADWQSAARVLRRLAFGGATAWQPWIADQGLGAALIEPALAEIRRLGGAFHVHQRITGIVTAGDRVSHLVFGGGRTIDIRQASAILALPAAAASALPELDLPAFGHRTIVCAHARLPAHAAGLPPERPFLGIVGGTAHWVAQRGDVVSITASAADSLALRPAAEILSILWGDLRRALPELDSLPERAIVIKERRATIAQTPASMARRPGAATRFKNLALAGDWTATGLPATLESAVISAIKAVEIIRSSNGGG